MLKRFTFVMMVLLLSIAVNAQQWVSFGGRAEGAPEVTVQSSTARSVSFEISIPGIYATDTVVNGTSYTRLILPGGFALNPVGSPENPVLTYKVAIPNCDGVDVSYNVVSRQRIPSCWVYPVPKIIFDSTTNTSVEQFAFNSAAYAQPYSPESAATVISTGALRAQKYREIAVKVVEFCPVSRQLSVIDKVEVTLTFANPVGDLRQNVGIFNSVATNAFINYEDDGMSALVNDKAYEKTNYIQGQVTWFNLTDTAQAKNISADYLILTVPEFFNPHNADLQRLANHRAYYNGYDVVIVNISQVLGLNFYYEDDPIITYKSEQKIRTFIRRVYEGKKAKHTKDGHLAFVLLVGEDKPGNNGMRASRDHNVTDFQGMKYPSDYYYTCVTKDNTGNYDPYGDLFIGRFSVKTSAHLYNMVQKTITHETINTIDSWRRTAGFTHGNFYQGFTTPLNNYLNEIANEKGWSYKMVDYGALNGAIRQPTLNYMNNKVIFMQYLGESPLAGYWFDRTSWEDNLNINFFDSELHNDYSTPFINTVLDAGCNFTYSDVCLGEFLTRSSPTKGAVGYVGATSLTNIMGYFTEPLNPNKLDPHARYPHFLIKKNISIAGDLMLTCKLSFLNELFLIREREQQYGYVLLGDPALNILAKAGCVTLAANSNLTTPVVLNEGECLTIPENGIVNLSNTGSITLNGGALEIGKNAKIIGNSQNNSNLFIKLQKGILDVGDGITIENAVVVTSYSLSNVKFNNVKFTRNNTENVALYMNNCSFNNCSVTLNNDNRDATITGSSFTNTILSLKSFLTNYDMVMKFANTQFTGSTISHSSRKFEATECTFTDCTVTLNNDNGDATVEITSFTNCQLNLKLTPGMMLNRMTFWHTQFTGCSIVHSNHQFKTEYCHFTDCNLTLNNNNNNEAIITNSFFTDCNLYSSSLADENPGLMELIYTDFTNSPIYHSQHKLKMTHCHFWDRSDIIANYPVVDISFCYFWASGFCTKLPIHPMPNALFTPFVKINKSTFFNTGEYIIGDDLIYGKGYVYSTASIMIDKVKEFEITGNTISNGYVSGGKGIVLPPNPVPYGEGIYLNNAGQGNVDNRLVLGNDISWCETGLYVYNSKATFKNNDIHDNANGIKLFNNSSTSFSGDASLNNGRQYIRNNSSYQLYATKGAFPQLFAFNIISKDNNPHSYPWIYYDETRGNDPGNPPYVAIHAEYNCWGSNFVQATDLYPAGRYSINPAWCPPAGGSGISLSPAEELYESALEYFANESYASAKTTFLNLITTYPQNELAIASLHELFALEQFLDNDYATLHDYYAAFTPADTTLFDVADFLATRCNVIDQNWQPAIDWYENRIENPPSYPDSVFAVIDLGDIHLMMENDSLKAGRVLRFPNLIPKSRRDYEKNKAELLATLPKMDKPQQPLAETGKKGVLSQNIPNPANGSTTVVYDVIKEGQVELRMYNQLGQLLQTLPQGTKKEGTYRIELSLAGLPAGMYHYILFINGEKADAKKLIVN